MKLFKYFISIIVVASLAVFVWFSDMTLVLNQLSQVGFDFLWVMLISCLGFFLGAVAWKFCFEENADIKLMRLFYIRTIGETITVLNPTNIIAGEASKIHLLKNENLRKNQKLDAVLISRVIMISSQLLLTLICLIYLAFIFDKLALVFYSTLGILLVVFAYQQLTKKRLLSLNFQHKKLRLLKVLIARPLMRINSFFKNNQRRTLIAFFFTTLHWFCGATEICIILTLLGVDISFFSALVMDMGIVTIKSFGSFVPAQIGIEEMGNKLMLELIGVTGLGLWLSVSILRRAKQLCWLALSVVFYFILNIISNLKTNDHGSIVYHS